jgi:hypothetical protein
VLGCARTEREESNFMTSRAVGVGPSHGGNWARALASRRDIVDLEMRAATQGAHQKKGMSRARWELKQLCGP